MSTIVSTPYHQNHISVFTIQDSCNHQETKNIKECPYVHIIMHVGNPTQKFIVCHTHNVNNGLLCKDDMQLSCKAHMPTSSY